MRNKFYIFDKWTLLWTGATWFVRPTVRNIKKRTSRQVDIKKVQEIFKHNKIRRVFSGKEIV